MTSRERLLAVLHHEIPDCVPCCPEITQSIPCRLTGKPFWDIYAYQNPPLWKAHIDAIKYFDIDGSFQLCDFGTIDVLDGTTYSSRKGEERIVHRYKDDGGFVTQKYFPETGEWARTIWVYTATRTMAYDVLPEKIGLPPVPAEWEPLTGVKKWPEGMELRNMIRKELGDHGILGLSSGISTKMLSSPEDIYAYYDDPEPFREKSRQLMAELEKRMELIAQMNPRPDFLDCGGSGSLIFQTPEILRELALPLLKRATEMASDLGIPTHVHSCGPEKELVKMAAEGTQLTVIDPLEIPPMGDCILKELKQRYGDKLVLKGNLHTTSVMLRGSGDDVVAASKQAIDDAAEGGGFILSSGDECGRDTPDDNIRAMVATARTYGKY